MSRTLLMLLAMPPASIQAIAPGTLVRSKGDREGQYQDHQQRDQPLVFESAQHTREETTCQRASAKGRQDQAIAAGSGMHWTMSQRG